MNLIDFLFKNRNWKEFRDNLWENIRIVPIIAVTLGLISFFKAFNIVLLTVYRGIGIIPITGLIVILCVSAYYLFISWPSKSTNTTKLVGKEILFNPSEIFYPELTKVGVTGLGFVGKTTLVNGLKQKPNPFKRTQILTLHITTSAEYPLKYFGILDGEGSNYSQQFEVINNSDILIILLDHNDQISGYQKLDEERLRESSQYQIQLRNSLKQKQKKFERIHILLNKSDLWSQMIPKEKATLEEWFVVEVERWKGSGFASYISSDKNHSSINQNNCTLILSKLSTNND